MARTDVERAADRAGQLQRVRERARHVRRVNEITALLTVLEDHRLLPVEQPRGEDREHAGIRVGERLARAVDVEQPQAHAFHPVRRGHDVRGALLHEFVERVDRREAGPLPLGRGERGERATLPVDRLPIGQAVLESVALGILHQRAVGIAVQPFAIDRHRRRSHDTADGAIDKLLEQHRGADVVGGGVAFHLVHRLADPDLGGEVDDAVHPLQRAGDNVAVAHIAADQLGIRVEQRGAPPCSLAAIAVDLLDQAVENADTVAAAEQFVGDEAADEAGTAGDQDRLGHRRPGRLDR